MKTVLLKLSFLALFILGVNNAFAHGLSTKKHVPDSFSISKTDFEKLFVYKVKAVVKNSSNPYLNKAVILLNNKVGSNKQLKLQLKGIAKAYLIVQVNGEDSTILFITSDDKSVFYKSRQYADKFVMIKCSEDDIVSE